MNPVVTLTGVGVRRGTRWLLEAINLEVGASDRWVIIGPNGAGKTTLLSIMSARMFPTVGSVAILDEELGGCDLSELKPRIGWASAQVAMDLPPHEPVRDVVVTGSLAVTGRWRDSYDAADHLRADALIERWGLVGLEDRTFGTLSEGERKRALIARALMPNPELLLLDEPGAGLDLGGREDLVHRLSELAADPCSPAIVMITHHVEEIPTGFTHAVLMADGCIVAAGPIGEALTSGHLSQAFGLPIQLELGAGRWSARLAAPTR